MSEEAVSYNDNLEKELLDYKDDQIHKFILQTPKFNYDFAKFFTMLSNRDSKPSVIKSVDYIKSEEENVGSRIRQGDNQLRIEDENSVKSLLVAEAQNYPNFMILERLNQYMTIARASELSRNNIKTKRDYMYTPKKSLIRNHKKRIHSIRRVNQCI